MHETDELNLKKTAIQVAIDKLERAKRATKSPIIQSVYEDEIKILENWKASLKPTPTK